MSERELKNIPASIHARLLNETKTQGGSFNQMLQFYVIERFLYRLSKTQWGERLIVKGAIMLRAWGAPLGRPTRDIDFLGRIDNSRASMARIVRECLAVDCPEDGLVFDPEFALSTINIDDGYPGIRAVLHGSLGRGVFKLQLDISIDDAVVPGPEWVDYPTLLDLDAPRILAYQPVTAVAEKYETMVSKGLTNSRLRDYYDIWLLAGSRPFDGAELAAAMSATFARRKTPLTRDLPQGLADAFSADADARSRWASFLKKGVIEAPRELAEVCRAIERFIMPPAAAAATGASFDLSWDPSSGWSA